MRDIRFWMGLGTAGFAVALHAEPVVPLPPKKPVTGSVSQLGDSQAVQEAKQMLNEPKKTPSKSGTAPAVSRDASLAQSNSAPPKIAESDLWIVLRKKPELGFLAGWAFTKKELSALVGDGFSYGLLAAQEVLPGVQAVLRVSGSHHHSASDAQSSSLDIFPLEFLGQFSRSIGCLSFYLQPGIGAAIWSAKSERLIDHREQSASGFDFMVSGGVGMKFRTESSPWGIGSDASLAYVSGYFGNYLTRVLVYTSYQF